MTDNKSEGQDDFYLRIRQILEAARVVLASTVNSVQVMSNWLIGQAIVEEEQQGRQQTEYGEHLLKNLAAKLKKDFGAGYSLANLKYTRQFYLSFPDLLNQMEIGHAVRDQFDLSAKEEIFVTQMPNEKTWQPGQLHPNLSWTHYRTLMRVERTEARAFYEIESVNIPTLMLTH